MSEQAREETERTRQQIADLKAAVVAMANYIEKLEGVLSKDSTWTRYNAALMVPRQNLDRAVLKLKQ